MEEILSCPESYIECSRVSVLCQEPAEFVEHISEMAK